MTLNEKVLLNEIVVNFDDIRKELTEEQKEKFRRNILKIYGNHLILLEGVNNENQGT